MLCCSESDWSELCDLHPIFCGSLSTLLHPVLASSFPLWLGQDFSKRAIFPIVCVDWFYKKAVSGVVKFWEFEGILRCSKILRIRRKNPMKWLKWVLSISRDYWVYLEITLQRFKIWEFWGIETFYRSTFSPATGVTCSRTCLVESFDFFGNKSLNNGQMLSEASGLAHLEMPKTVINLSQLSCWSIVGESSLSSCRVSHWLVNSHSQPSRRTLERKKEQEREHSFILCCCRNYFCCCRNYPPTVRCFWLSRLFVSFILCFVVLMSARCRLHTGWPRLIGSAKLQIVVQKRAT